MSEKRILSWKEFGVEMPVTIEEYQTMDGENIAWMEEWTEKRPVIKNLNDDPKQKVIDMGHLMVYASDRVSLRHPTLEHEGDCLRRTVVALIKELTGSPSLAKAASSAFQTLRLTTAGANAKTVKNEGIKVNPETGKDLEREVRRLDTRWPSFLHAFSSAAEFELVIDATAAEAKRSKDKKSLSHIKNAGGVLTRVDPEDWPLLEGLKKRGEQLVVTTRESNGSNHMDLITRIDAKNGLVDTKVFGERQIRELEAGMQFRNRPLTLIPPLGIAPPDKEEIEIRRKLEELPWNPNLK